MTEKQDLRENSTGLLRRVAAAFAAVCIGCSAVYGCSLRPAGGAADSDSESSRSLDHSGAAVSVAESVVTEPETEPVTDPVTEPVTEPETEPGVLPPENPSTSSAPSGLHSNGYSEETPYSPVVLMYHSVLEEPFTSLTGLFVRPVDFENQLDCMNRAGYEYLFADEFAYTSGKSVMITLDDGYEDNYTEVFPLLKKYNAKATVFMIAYKVGEDGYLTKEQMKEMADSGLVRFGSHTRSHPNLVQTGDEEIRDELEGSAWVISQITGTPVKALCYPGGFVDDRVRRIAAESYSFAYTTVSSANTAGCDPLLIPRVRVNRGMSGATLVSVMGG